VIVEPATRERITLRLAVILCCLFLGTSITEATSVYLLPLTIELFTRNPQYIALILAINPVFGFIAQPLVGVWSDRIWTRVGRRAFFLIVCAPVAAAALVLIPFAAALWQLVVLVVVLQFFEDMLYGSDQPLLADLVPPEQRTLMLGLIKGFENLGFLLVLYVGMKLVAGYRESFGTVRYGMPMYLLAAAAQILLVMLPAFFLNEKKYEPVDRPRLTPMQYIRDFMGVPMLPRIAAAYFLRSFTRTAVVGFVSLYAVRTLLLSEDELGSSWGLMPFVALSLGIPLGLAVERFAKHRVLQVGFAAITVSCAVGYVAGSTAALAAAAVIFGFGDMMLEVTHKAFMSDHYPVHLIGQLTGAVNIFYATGRTAALLFVGSLVKWVNPGLDFADASASVDYGAIWIVSAVSSLVGVAILSTVRDFRHEAKIAAETGGR
jgi:MFS family permease